ncbi:SWI/SNF-related matrix-associated actin-dependent regulator of chromatin subfamily A-like protein 1 isoform X1 [Halichondria panicea]|uniref:SWI/SNF-related matrix-associated actin-dependent regulator of chromatin subfamily A-like protein 1 isoform X1 n=1 Tax=Halichondria panicea TaxID=6063 RepID=UPI00312B8FEC
MASTFPSSSSYNNVRSHPNSAEASSSSSAGNQVQESKWSNPLISHQGSSSSTKTLSLPRTGTLHNELPSSMTSQTGLQQPPFYSKPSTSHLSTLFHNSPPKSAPNKAVPVNSRIPPFYSKPPLNAPHLITSVPDASIKVAAAMSRKPSPSLPPDHPPPVKCTQLRDKKKAQVCIVSRTRLEVKVQYDHDLIEIFKKMPTRAYNTKTSLWSFGIEDYNSLVKAIQSSCKHVELDLIPRPVVNLFLSQLQAQSHSIQAKSHSSVIDWSRIETKLSTALMEFQKEGVEYSIKRDGRVLIADDMGLGKTLQAIAVMSYYRSDWPLLVVCPSSVRLTWAEAFKRWIPSLVDADINVILTTKGCGSFCLVNIISYDLLVRMSKDITEHRFSAIIADESHFLKNYRTARSKAAIPVIKSARRAVLLSGTPALSRPIELYTQITAVDKNFRLVSHTQFGLRYCNGVKSQFGWDFSGASNMSELQLYLEDSIMIRRMKSEVLDQLPSKTRKMVLLDLSSLKGGSKEWKDYKRQLNDAGKLKKLERRTALLPLFDVTGKMKLPAVKDYILDMLEGGRKIIVFGHHVSVLNGLCEALDKKAITYIRIDGKTPADMRQALCDQFQHSEQCQVAVLSITTANAGLTLTAASTVIFAELFWNPGILVQAEDRAYRIGQKSSVNVHYLIAKDTVDDFIWPLIQNKLSVLSQAGLAKDDFSSAESAVLTAKDATQKTLMDCFRDLVSKSEMDQLSNFDDTLELDTPGTSVS